MHPLDDPHAGPGGRESLRETTAVWEAHAQADPLWAVLSDPVRAGRRWDLDTFLESGRHQVDQALVRLDALGGTLVDHALALDFGSGVGRLSQALGDRFERVLGLDVSPTMVAVARRLNRHGERVTFRCNDSDRLEGVASGSVSLALSFITLQHVPPALARGYLTELLRVVQPGGAAIVQVPSHLDEAFLPSDRDDRPVEIEDRRAELLLEPPAGPLRAGVPASVRVRVTNRSRRPWVQCGPHALNVGSHWSDGKGTVLPGHGRARLPARMEAGSSAEVDLLVTPPAPGTYHLSVDVVQEGICWFGGNDRGPWWRRRGPASDQAIVTVEPSPVSESDSGEADGGMANFGDLVSTEPSQPPPFEMHPIPRAEVEAIVRAAGARLLGVDDSVDDWHHLTYYIGVNPVR